MFKSFSILKAKAIYVKGELINMTRARGTQLMLVNLPFTIRDRAKIHHLYFTYSYLVSKDLKRCQS